MRLNNPRVLVSALCLIACALSLAQSPSQRNPDVSNKALITKSTPSINADAFKKQSVSAETATLHKLADEYYAWRNENYPVRSSDVGLHTWDDRLTDYSPGKIADRAQHARSLLEKVRAMKTDNPEKIGAHENFRSWPKDERIDWILFRAQLENVEFGVPRLAANGAAMRINYAIDGNTNTEKDRAGLRLLPMSEVMIQEV